MLTFVDISGSRQELPECQVLSGFVGVSGVFKGSYFGPKLKFS
jgi:hypothetical protein